MRRTRRNRAGCGCAGGGKRKRSTTRRRKSKGHRKRRGGTVKAALVPFALTWAQKQAQRHRFRKPSKKVGKFVRKTLRV